jgi:hypothetical protein
MLLGLPDRCPLLSKYLNLRLFFIAGVTPLISPIPLPYTVIATTHEQPGIGNEFTYPWEVSPSSQIFINANNGFEINTCFAHVSSNVAQNDLLGQAITHMCDFQLLFYLGDCQKSNNTWMYCVMPNLQKYIEYRNISSYPIPQIGYCFVYPQICQ